MNLLTIPKGDTACITDLSEVPIVIRQRLMHLGICDGCQINVKQILPFGGPYVIEYVGQTIGIRQVDAKRILVKKL